MTPIPAPLPAFRQLARPCATLGCGNVLSAADRDGRCTACHDDRTVFDQYGCLRPETLKPCARCGVRPRQYANMPYCRECKNEIARESHARSKRKGKR